MKLKSTVKLSAEAQDIYDSLSKSYNIQDDAGILLLQSAMEAFDRLRSAQRLIKKHGILIMDTRWKQLKNNPAILIETNARSQLLLYFKALNLEFENI